MTNDIQLDDWFKQQADDSASCHFFPRQDAKRYLAQYNKIALDLEPIHKEVEKAAMRIDGGYLTDHGPEHIKRVIQRASDLNFRLNLNITPYEAYLLLMAIQLHDIGNGLGRIGHERRIGEVVNMLGDKMGENHAENRLIQKIAVAHGGHVGDDSNDLDTLGALQKYEPYGDQQFNMQLLAATLRLADELADDDSRASRYASYFGTLPVSSEVFHEYARSLHTVRVNAEEKRIDLGFDLTPDSAKRKWGRLEKDLSVRQVYLFDEIHERTWKMYRECMYCMRYMRSSQPGMRAIDGVKVKVEVLSNANKSVYTPMGSDGIETIEYVIQEKGYPKRNANTLAELVEDLLPPDGVSLKQAIEKQERNRRRRAK